MLILTAPYAFLAAACVIYQVNCTLISVMQGSRSHGAHTSLLLQITSYFLRLKIQCIRDKNKNWQVLFFSIFILILVARNTIILTHPTQQKLHVLYMEFHEEKFQGIVFFPCPAHLLCSKYIIGQILLFFCKQNITCQHEKSFCLLMVLLEPFVHYSCLI